MGLVVNGVCVLSGGNAVVVDEVCLGWVLVGFIDVDDVWVVNCFGAGLVM